MAYSIVVTVGELVGMSHNINSKRMPQGLMVAQRLVWIQFSCPLGIISDEMKNMEV